MEYRFMDIEPSYLYEADCGAWSREEVLLTLEELGDRASELLDEISELAGETKRVCAELDEMRDKLNGLKELF